MCGLDSHTTPSSFGETAAVVPSVPRVLIVDDDDELRRALARLLRRAGYGVLEADTAESAMEMVFLEDLDLVLTDLRLPGRSGLDLLAAINQQRPDLPVVLHTAQLDDTVQATAEALGAVCTLAKPVRREALLVALRSALPGVIPES